MPKERATLQPWQIFSAAMRTLGRVKLGSLLGVGERTAYLYGENPAYTAGKRCRCPLERIHGMFSELATFGRSDVCRAAIDYLRSSYEEVESGPVEDLKPTVRDELLADYSAVASLQRAIEACEDIDLVETLVQKAKAEIDRTHARYLKDCK